MFFSVHSMQSSCFVCSLLQPFIQDAIKKALDGNIGSLMKDIVNGANKELLKVHYFGPSAPFGDGEGVVDCSMLVQGSLAPLPSTHYRFLWR